MLERVWVTSVWIGYWIQVAHLVCQLLSGWYPWASLSIVKTKRSKFDSRILSKVFPVLDNELCLIAPCPPFAPGTTLSKCRDSLLTHHHFQFFFFFFSDLTQYTKQGFGTRHMCLWVLTPSWFNHMTLVDSFTLWSGPLLSPASSWPAI